MVVFPPFGWMYDPMSTVGAGVCVQLTRGNLAEPGYGPARPVPGSKDDSVSELSLETFSGSGWLGGS